ncbi:MAG: RNA methyltransferase [Treponema sp.]|nr:RNA methyltransferase [Treponema sp.]
MDLTKIYILLDRPEESRNIGAACRAMANNGIEHLRIVGKRDDYDDTKVRILAIHAAALWEQAEFYVSITEATADCVLSAGTTRRRGKNRKGKLLYPEEFSKKASAITGDASGGGGKIAIVFGNERTGLTDSEMQECMIGVTIPSCKKFASLNLSHAVQIICYHLFREKNSGMTGYSPITLKRLQETVTTITEKLEEVGFFSVTGKPEMKNFWTGILSRAALSEGEAKYIEKIFTKTAGLAKKNKGKADPRHENTR